VLHKGASLTTCRAGLGLCYFERTTLAACNYYAAVFSGKISEIQAKRRVI
jgi:hypothetical protein